MDFIAKSLFESKLSSLSNELGLNELLGEGDKQKQEEDNENEIIGPVSAAERNRMEKEKEDRMEEKRKAHLERQKKTDYIKNKYKNRNTNQHATETQPLIEHYGAQTRNWWSPANYQCSCLGYSCNIM
eukprot:TRINITY_DN9053_c0_g1_i1.p1 TRINITY_DN9053_c0_g1~~TRINITY_DN9053_c0_g1_i1.p1  ORF type:complete len:138 (-),score=37.89 TRINITY_DN9053_c0_g1_i1:81-464(-)